MNMPIIRFELDRVKESVASMLCDRNDEINNYIIQALNKELSESWVIDEIDCAVKNALKNAIGDIATDWNLQQAISKLIAVEVAKKLAVKQED